ncbi:hypothetical protein CkaCkLH20_00338 [Colletotrichum karsti]|uniref:Uncharacterized protein n=1 Tax=Colletotrichum karsti TaxID=1095194 RepID=A0A9P6LRB2_9PEZI|nr:uncharacterized protein CkaCkLH20_00338 [Colletotrichum karsti]KAF9882302.1 hypothetical protein CkaCkLH20_00338 [Colletotrichum karsti]
MWVRIKMADEGDQPGDDQFWENFPQQISFNLDDQQAGNDQHYLANDQQIQDGSGTGSVPGNDQYDFANQQQLHGDPGDDSSGDVHHNFGGHQQFHGHPETDSIPGNAQHNFADDGHFYVGSGVGSVPVQSEHNLIGHQQFQGGPGNASMSGDSRHIFANQQHFQGLGHGSAPGNGHRNFAMDMQYHNVQAHAPMYGGGQQNFNFNNAQQPHSNPNNFHVNDYGSQIYNTHSLQSQNFNQSGYPLAGSSSFDNTQQHMNNESGFTVNPSDLSTPDRELHSETWQQHNSLHRPSSALGPDPTLGFDPATEMSQPLSFFPSSPMPLQPNIAFPSTNVTEYHSQPHQTYTGSHGQVSGDSAGEQYQATNNQPQHVDGSVTEDQNMFGMDTNEASDDGDSKLFVQPGPGEDVSSYLDLVGTNLGGTNLDNIDLGDMSPDDIDKLIRQLEQRNGLIDNQSQPSPAGDGFALAAQPGGTIPQNNPERPSHLRPDINTRDEMDPLPPITLDADSHSIQTFMGVNGALYEAINGGLRHFPAIPPILPRLLPGEIRDHRSVNRPRDAFSIILDKALGMGLRDVLGNGGVKFTIGTMCSGTDGPIMALQEFQDALVAAGLSNTLQFEHKFSVEIEPFKQAFINRNARPTGHIYRNVNDFGMPGATEAMTVSGAMEPIPKDIDILVAGSSCVDFSVLNKKKLQRKEASGMSKLGSKVTGEKGRDPTVALQDNEEDPATALHDDEEEPVGAPQYDGEPVVALQDDEEFLAQLNDLTNNLRDEHESTKTFVSILQYIRQNRPKIMILENVVSAPWNQFRFYYAKIGYDTRFAKVDAKWYLMPQTRQRIYLIAVDRRRYGEKANGIVREWEKTMSQKWFEQPPNLQKFLLQPSDPQILQGRYMLELKAHNRPKRDVEAVACMMEHRTARRKYGLGDGNPFTQLDARGIVRPREDSWIGYIRNWLTGRMQDLVDINCLKGFQKGVDISHKAIVYDIGQNVQRQRDSLGALPCILPNADLFLSIQGRPILGLEGLALQGIPIDRMKSSRESEVQLKSLAGNAMTTTVVGAGTLSALIFERKFVEDPDNPFFDGLRKASDVDVDMDSGAPRLGFAREVGPGPASTSFATAPALPAGNPSSNNNSCLSKNESATNNAVSSTTMATASSSLELAEGPDWRLAEVDGSDPPVWLLRMLCQEGRRYCLCDTYRKHKNIGEYYMCDYCAEIRCISCIGNPEHNFDMDRPINVLSNDRRGAYRDTVARLPGTLEISLGDDGDVRLCEKVLGNGFQSHQDALKSAIRTCAGGVEYFQTDVNFRDDLTITYESAKSRILIVATHASVTWNVYLRGAFFDKNASCEITDPRYLLNNLGYDLEQPLMRATLTDAPSFIPTAND